MAKEIPHNSLAAPVFEKAPKVLLVVAPYYVEITNGLVAGAKGVLEAVSAEVETIEVPGALEIPPSISIAGRMADFDGFVALGCVIRGETSHYDTVCNDSSHGIMELGLKGYAIGNGILTVENYPQAQERADPSGLNKGGGAAIAALHLIHLGQKWRQQQSKSLGFISGGSRER